MNHVVAETHDQLERTFEEKYEHGGSQRKQRVIQRKKHKPLRQQETPGKARKSTIVRVIASLFFRFCSTMAKRIGFKGRMKYTNGLMRKCVVT